MSKTPKILPLAAALAALAGISTTVSDPANAKLTEPTEPDGLGATSATKPTPNRIVSMGEDFLGFTVTTAADGTVVADHSSHYSHSSHSSHYSSSR